MSQRSQRERKLPKSDLSSPLLIHHVAEFPVIWDHHRPDHRERGAVEAAFEEISKRFYGSEGKHCSDLWKNLCDRRGKHNQRTASKVRSGSAAQRIRPFKYAREMSFLDKVPQDALGEGNLSFPAKDGSKRVKLNTIFSESEESSQEEDDTEKESSQEEDDTEKESSQEEDETEDSPQEKDRDASQEEDVLNKTAEVDEPDVMQFTMLGEEEDLKKRRGLPKAVIIKKKKQKKFDKKREELKKKIAEQVKSHKASHQQAVRRPVKTVKTGCSLDDLLVQELQKITEDSDIDLFFKSVAVRLKRLPSEVCHKLLSDFMKDIFRELYN